MTEQYVAVENEVSGVDSSTYNVHSDRQELMRLMSNVVQCWVIPPDLNSESLKKRLAVIQYTVHAMRLPTLPFLNMHG